jgi:hypothetical protein
MAHEFLQECFQQISPLDFVKEGKSEVGITASLSKPKEMMQGREGSTFSKKGR